MALNYSLRPLFPAHLPEDNLVLPMRIANGYLVEGIPERNRDGFARQWSREVQDRGDNMDWENVLPVDPFGMDVDINLSSTVLTEFLESLEYGACGRSDVGVGKGDCSLFAELNFLFSKAMDFQSLMGNKKMDDKVFVADTVDARLCEELGHPFCDGGLNFVCTMNLNAKCEKDDKVAISDTVDRHISEDSLSHSLDDDGGFDFSYTTDCHGKHQKDEKILTGDTIDDIGATSNSAGESIYMALSLVMGYLGVRDLLSVEVVCKSLFLTVRKDPHMWTTVHIDQPLNDLITDDILLHLSSRSQGNLQCLSLVECQRITDDGLRRVFQSNLKLTKLSVPGCTRLSIDGVVNCLRNFKSVAIIGIKNLRIGGLYGVTQKHFDELISLLGIQNEAQANRNKPLFYNRGSLYLSCEDERPMDIEPCPSCHKPRLVYDCPAYCQGKDQATHLRVRACTLCIHRCVHCGNCISDGQYVENFYLEFLCLACWKQSSICQEKHDIQPSSSCAVTLEPVSSFHG